MAKIKANLALWISLIVLAITGTAYVHSNFPSQSQFNRFEDKMYSEFAALIIEVRKLNAHKHYLPGR